MHMSPVILVAPFQDISQNDGCGATFGVMEGSSTDQDVLMFSDCSALTPQNDYVDGLQVAHEPNGVQAHCWLDHELSKKFSSDACSGSLGSPFRC